MRRSRATNNTFGSNKGDKLQSVRFQSETDKWDNFPDNQTFQDFRRQRDVFYDILRGWHHVIQHGEKSGAAPNVRGGRKSGKGRCWPKPGSLLEEHYVQEMQNFITLQMNPINMAHFAQLFQDQLLTMALNELLDDGQPDDMSREMSMSKVDPDKLKRLMNRCLTPSNFGGPCPKPDFPGAQEFFKDFIQVAGGNLSFLSHLKNNMITTVVELNEKIFEVAVGEFSDDSDLAIAILKLRVLGKFLGHIESLPY